MFLIISMIIRIIVIENIYKSNSIFFEFEFVILDLDFRFRFLKNDKIDI
jgi:hypothetical protein